MVIAGVVVKVVNGTEKDVANYLASKSLVSVEGSTTGNIAVVIEAANTKSLETMTSSWQEDEKNILGVYPVYINVEEALQQEHA